MKLQMNLYLAITLYGVMV